MSRKAPPRDFAIKPNEPVTPEVKVERDATREAVMCLVVELVKLKRLHKNDLAKWKTEQADTTFNFFAVYIQRMFQAVATLSMEARPVEANAVLGTIDAMLILADDPKTTEFFVSYMKEFRSVVAEARRLERPLNRSERDALRRVARAGLLK